MNYALQCLENTLAHKKKELAGSITCRDDYKNKYEQYAASCAEKERQIADVQAAIQGLKWAESNPEGNAK